MFHDSPSHQDEEKLNHFSSLDSSSFFREFLIKIEEGNNLQRKILATQQEILNAVQENNDLQKQVLEKTSRLKKEKRKISSISSTIEHEDFDDSESTISNNTTLSNSTAVNTVEKERKKSKKNVQCSDDELCIIYEGSSNHALIVRKDLLKGPVLKTAVSGNFLQESKFILPSDSIKLSNISKAMKQLKKFFHSEKLDRCNEEGKKDLNNLADFLVLPELKLELLKFQICEIPTLKTNTKKNTFKNYDQVFKQIEEVATQLPGILIDLENDDLVPVLESFHEFVKSDESRAKTLRDVTDYVWTLKPKPSNRGILAILLFVDSLDGVKYHLLEECATHKDLYNIDLEKAKILAESISGNQWKKNVPPLIALITIHQTNSPFVE